MSTAFELRLEPEIGYVRHAMLALEVLDAVSLERVSTGITVTAHGLLGKPTLNWGRLFVWLKEDTAALTGIAIETGSLPFERRDIPLAEVTFPRTVVELAPTPAYPFAPGVTAVRARLVEDRLVTPAAAVPGAEVWVQWLDDDGVTWRDAPTHSHTNSHGDFAAIARLVATDVPRLDANGAISARLRARRAGGVWTGAPFALAQGRVADALTFAWDELQP